MNRKKFLLNYRGLLIFIFILGIISVTPQGVKAQGAQPVNDITIEEFQLPRGGVMASGITVAPNGDVWFTEWSGQAIGRLSTDGSITEFPTPGSNSYDITVGADGNIWFTEPAYGESGGNIGRITPEGILTEFRLPTQTQFSPHNITLGPDGNIWFTEAGNVQIGKITPAGEFTEYSLPDGVSPHGLLAGPDGNIWFTDYGSGNVGKLTLDGQNTVTIYQVGSSGPFEIVLGSDGNFWFGEYWGPNVYRMTPGGMVTRFPIPSGVGTRSVAAGADGNIWFVESQNNKVGRITMDGSMTEYLIPTENSFPTYITSDSYGNIWFTEYFGDKIGRIKLNLNQPPVITALTAPIAPVQLGQTIDATIMFSDPDVSDTHTVLWVWGDGSTTIIGASVPSKTTSHLYPSTGVYTISATITDASGESASATFQYVVIYDPNGGFVTGGGWINSPTGAYRPDPSLLGKATFGFVSKYQKGAEVPSGDTEFQFKVADLNFKSTTYDWLVIAGSKAQYKGTGTINGVGNYSFILTAADGSPDKFRIKIWDETSGVMVYDNMFGTTDDANPTTALGGGSIVIHK